MPNLKSKRRTANARNTLKEQTPEQLTKRIKKTTETKKRHKAEAATEKKVFEVVRKMMNLEETGFGCSHYLIGAASFEYLMRGRYNMFRAHQHLKMRHPDNDYNWKIGEDLSASWHTGYYRQAFRVHPYVPFICAKADLAGNDTITETKTASSESRLARFKNKTPRDVMTQMQITMECFGVSEGRLDVIYFDATPFEQGKKNYTKGKIVYKHKHILVRKANLICETSIPTIVQRYVVFLRRYFAAAGIIVPEKTLPRLETLILEIIKTKKLEFEQRIEDAAESRMETMQDILLEIAEKSRKESIGRICRQHDAQKDTPFRHNPKGDIVEPPPRNDQGFSKDPFNPREWYRNRAEDAHLTLINVTEDACAATLKSYKKSLLDYIANGHEEGEHEKDDSRPPSVSCTE